MRVALSGQPMVVAGGALMRLRQLRAAGGQLEYSVDFPQLVGDQYNEFTMDVGLSSGLGCTPPSPVQSMSTQSERPGLLTLPPLDVDRVRWYNPATLSPGGLMWYAVNPSYDFAHSFWAACRGPVLSQIMITSTYAPIRLWRVRYDLQDACYNPPGSTEPVCTPDIAVGYSLPTHNIPLHGDSIPISACAGTYDLWVESLEYFDDLNIAVTVSSAYPLLFGLAL